MFKAISLWADRKMGLPEGWVLLIALLALAVLMHWVVTLFQLLVYLHRP